MDNILVSNIFVQNKKALVLIKGRKHYSRVTTLIYRYFTITTSSSTPKIIFGYTLAL